MIGIYDSGVGGLALLREVRAMLPHADLMYLADQANVPYGGKSVEEVRDLAEIAAGQLIDRGSTTVAVACNSASAAAIKHLREVYAGTTFVGMEPAVKPAAEISKNGVIGVLATDATFAAGGFETLVGRFANGSDVIAHSCPGWATGVENGWPEGSEETIREHLKPLLSVGVDTLVLGCTHYSFLGQVIAGIAGEEVQVVDPMPAVARQVDRVAHHDDGTGQMTFLTTGDPARFATQVQRLLGLTVDVAAID